MKKRPGEDVLADELTVKEIAAHAIGDLRYAIKQLELVEGSMGLGTYAVDDCLFRALDAIDRTRDSVREAYRRYV